MAHRCKVCRRSFPTGRALGGHMRSHVSSGDLQQSPKKVRRLSDSGEMRCEECGREFSSWRALFGHMSCHSEKSTPEERGGALDGSCSSAGEFNSDDEEENCAINLMRLSRGSWEALDKNGSALGDSGNCSRKVESRFDDESDLVLGKNAVMGEDLAEKRNQFECKPCNRVFHSYQALGGHRASHKRMKGCHWQNRIDINGGCHSLETAIPIDEFVGGHQCVICGRVFNSGQALGGHMRSHFVMNSGFHAACPIVIPKQRFEVPNLLDCNLHPSERGEKPNSWWMGGNLKHEQLVGVISNSREDYQQ